MKLLASQTEVALTSADEVRGEGGAWSADVLEEARQTILAVMRGTGGRNAQARIRAAEVVLGKEFLAHLPADVLLAEVKRRAAAERRG